LILAKCKLIYENKITRYFSVNIQRKGKYLHQDCSIRIASAVDVGTIFKKPRATVRDVIKSYADKVLKLSTF